ncbi:reverse transcriptase zinc-binding domain-containing protein [Tanacetum coccineum]
MSWGWRKILQLRPIIREFIWHKIGNGTSTSLWFDTWCQAGPLAKHVSSRDIFRSGLNPKSRVSDIINEGIWEWPHELLDKYPVLNTCFVQISNERDRLEWRLSDGTVKNFSVSQVWSSIRPRDVKVAWYDMVWFAANIPRHAFNLWLIIKHKLKTQDRVYVWDVSNTLGSTCSLCEATPDSHEHLFFMCPFSNDVWDHMKKLAGLDRVVHDVYAIIHHIGPKAKRRSSHIVIAKLVVAASAYFIWQERNWRLFKKTKRTVNQVIECIKSAVRLKLLSCSFKRSSEGVMDAPTIPVSADSSEGNFEDAIDIGADVVHPVPIAAVAFPAVTIVTTLSRHEEAIRGIHEHLQGVPIEEEMSTLRFRMGMAEAENASLRGKIKTMEAIQTVTRRQERKARIEMGQQLALV